MLMTLVAGSGFHPRASYMRLVTAILIACVEAAAEFSYSYSEGYFSLVIVNKNPLTTLELSHVQARDAGTGIAPTSGLKLAPDENISFTNLFGHQLWAKLFFEDVTRDSVRSRCCVLSRID